MKLIEQSAELWIQGPEYTDLLTHIERCARVCYKSEDKITEDSAEKFIKRLIDNHHTAMLEHGTVYFDLSGNNQDTDKYTMNPYSKVINNAYVTTNYRVLADNNWISDLQYLNTPLEEHKRRFTIHFICSRAVAQELTRHRVFSFAMESQRYCAYDKGKFDKEVTFIAPSWLGKLCPEGVISNQNTGYSDRFTLNDYYDALQSAEHNYMDARAAGLQAQEARDILPNATKTELVMTGFEDDWKQFFDLRLRGLTGKPHPDMKELAKLAHNEFMKNGIML